MRRSIHTLMLTLALLLGLQSLALAATAELDQQATNDSGSIGDAIGMSWDHSVVLQTFTAGKTGDLTKVAVSLRIGAYANHPIAVEIRNANSVGNPDEGLLLASGHVAPADATFVLSRVEVAFGTPAQIEAGTSYALVLRASHGDNWMYGRFHSDVYTSGSLFMHSLGEWRWPFDGGFDLYFQTFVVSANPPALTYTFSGFQAPLNPDPSVLNVAKAGQTIPLAFRVTLDGAPVSDLTMATIALTSVPMPCDGGDAGETVVASVAGKSGLQNLGDGYYQYNWATQKGWANTCRQLQLDLGDGLTHTAIFQFKK